MNNKVLEAIKSHKDLIAYNRKVEKEALNKVQNAVESLDLGETYNLLNKLEKDSQEKYIVESVLLSKYKKQIIRIGGNNIAYDGNNYTPKMIY